MFLSTEAPEELLYGGEIPGVFTGDGCVLEAVEDLPAGPWLAVLLDSVDVSRLTSWELPAYLRACARLESWAASRKTGAVAELASRSDLPGADKEVALALREPVGAAQSRIHFSRRMRRLLPETWRRFREGRLSEKHATAVSVGTAGCDDPQTLARVEERVYGREGALGKTPAELRRDARESLNRLDPAGAQERAREARDQAATAKNGGDPRRMGVLRVEGLARLAGAYLDGGLPGLAAPRSGGLPVEVGVVVGLRTALGLEDLPGEVPGQGIVPREVIGELIGREQAKLRLMVIDENTGRLVYRAESRYRPTPAQIAHVRAGYVHSTGPGSQVLAGRTDTGHIPAWPQGPTQIGHLVPKDRSWHEAVTNGHVKASIDHSGTVTWTTVSGQTRTVTPYDYRLEPAAADEPAAPSNDEQPPPF
jgi:hypothetical protein